MHALVYEWSREGRACDTDIYDRVLNNGDLDEERRAWKVAILLPDHPIGAAAGVRA